MASLLFDGHPEGEPENDDFICFDLCAILDVLMHLEYFDPNDISIWSLCVLKE